jgi:predicted RNA-binding Zn-ribbon protein involved in translation (DUF1610 family)
MEPTPLNRSLDQEVLALVRGVSLECPVCGEFVVRLPRGGIFCPECGSGLDMGEELAFHASAGGRRETVRGYN